jgi:hypothetical protein
MALNGWQQGSGGPDLLTLISPHFDPKRTRSKNINAPQLALPR